MGNRTSRTCPPTTGNAVAYSVEVRYAIRKDTNLDREDATLVSLAGKHGCKWTASDIGPLRQGKGVRKQRDVNLEFRGAKNMARAPEFVSALPSHMRVLFTHALDENGGFYVVTGANARCAKSHGTMADELMWRAVKKRKRA